MGVEEKIQEIEEEISSTPYNKSTQHHIGKLKAKLAKLREKQEKQASSGGGGGFAVKKTGDATVALVGFPSVGKSTLLNRLTDADSKIGEYDFTTLQVIPGVMIYKKARIQILDLPGVITGSYSGRGKGKQIYSMARAADLVLILVDGTKPGQLDQILYELHGAGFRLDKKRPRVKVEKLETGGIHITSSVNLSLQEDTIKSILHEYGYHNAHVIFHEDVSADQLIDVLSNNRVYLPSVVAVNKIDRLDPDDLSSLKDELSKDFVPISAEKGTNINELKEEIHRRLNLIRVYMKPRNDDPDYEEPLILRKGATIRDVCKEIHRRFEQNFRYARVWGQSAKFGGQKQNLDHRLCDEDVLSIIMK